MVDSSYPTHSQISLQFNSKKLQTHLIAVLCIEIFRENNLGQNYHFCCGTHLFNPAQFGFLQHYFIYSHSQGIYL